MYDYLIVGAGIFGSVFAHEAHKRGLTCLVVDKRDHIAGNCYCEIKNDISIHRYGAHIFHTDKEEVWTYVNEASSFTPYIHKVKARYKNELITLPFNLTSFQEVCGLNTATEVEEYLRTKKNEYSDLLAQKENLESKALSLVGEKIYEKLIKHYSRKQWNRPCTEIPAFIIERLAVRLNHNSSYFNDPYQALPSNSYNELFSYWLSNADLLLNTDYLSHRSELNAKAKKVLYTGALDAFYNYDLGALAYRSLDFQHELIKKPQFQELPVINYTGPDEAYTRILEHKLFPSKLHKNTAETLITYEFPLDYQDGREAYYPINDIKNNNLHQQYWERGQQETQFIFGGRLAEYKYYDMDDAIYASLKLAREKLSPLSPKNSTH